MDKFNINFAKNAQNRDTFLIGGKYMGPILGQNLVNVWVSFHFPSGTSLNAYKNQRLAYMYEINPERGWAVIDNRVTLFDEMIMPSARMLASSLRKYSQKNSLPKN